MNYDISDGGNIHDNHVYYDGNHSYDKYNDIDNDIYGNALLWGVSILSVTYCTASLLNSCKGVFVHNNRDPSTLSSAPLVDLSTIQYDDCTYDIENTLDTCPICFVGYKLDENLIRLNCGHIYHKVCVFDWFKNNRSCPMCRLSV